MTQGGFGLTCKITVNSALTAIAKIIDGDMPEFEKMVVDVTAHDTTNGWAQWMATGKRVAHEFTLTLLWDVAEATHAALVTAFDSNATVNMSIEDPNGDEVIAFAAHITKLGRVSKQDDAYKCDVTIQPTDNPTIT